MIFLDLEYVSSANQTNHGRTLDRGRGPIYSLGTTKMCGPALVT